MGIKRNMMLYNVEFNYIFHQKMNFFRKTLVVYYRQTTIGELHSA